MKCMILKVGGKCFLKLLFEKVLLVAFSGELVLLTPAASLWCLERLFSILISLVHLPHFDDSIRYCLTFLLHFVGVFSPFGFRVGFAWAHRGAVDWGPNLRCFISFLVQMAPNNPGVGPSFSDLWPATNLTAERLAAIRVNYHVFSHTIYGFSSKDVSLTTQMEALLTSLKEEVIIVYETQLKCGLRLTLSKFLSQLCEG